MRIIGDTGVATRRVLLGIGAALSIGVAGCGDGDNGDGAQTPAPQTEAPQAAQIPESTSAVDPVLGGSAPETTQSASAPAADRDTPWVVPDGWELDSGERPMRVATYLAPVEGGTVEVAITRFPGTVGGELANVNRWRGQMGLSPVGEAELDGVIERFSSAGYRGYQTRVDGAGGVMVVAGVHDQSIDQTWFVRATVGNADQADAVEADVFSMARSIAGLGE